MLKANSNYVLPGSSSVGLMTLLSSVPAGCRCASCWDGGPGQLGRQGKVPPEMWAQRVEVMQLELSALTQRVEALGRELRAAAEHLAAAKTGNESGLI